MATMGNRTSIDDKGLRSTNTFSIDYLCALTNGAEY